MVNGNSDALGELSWKTGSLELFEGESTAGSDLHVVFRGWAVDDRSESIGRSWGNLRGLLNSGTSSPELLARLVEPGLDSRLPVLSEMVSGKDVVMFDGHLFYQESIL